MRKKEDITDYCTAEEAARLLSIKHKRIIRTDYISKMAKSTYKHHIRVARYGNRQMYHRKDIDACVILSKKKLK